MVDSDLILLEYRAMANKIQQQITSYHKPYYEGIVLSRLEIDELQSLSDSCCEMIQGFMGEVKEGKWPQHD